MNLRLKYNPVAWAAGFSTVAKLVTAYLTVQNVITADQAAAIIAGESTVFVAISAAVRAFVTPTVKLATEAPIPQSGAAGPAVPDVSAVPDSPLDSAAPAARPAPETTSVVAPAIQGSAHPGPPTFLDVPRTG